MCAVKAREELFGKGDRPSWLGWTAIIVAMLRRPGLDGVYLADNDQDISSLAVRVRSGTSTVWRVEVGLLTCDCSRLGMELADGMSRNFLRLKVGR